MRFLLSITFFTIVCSVWSQNKITLLPQIKAVSIFLEGAEINNQLTTDLKKGRNEIYIKGLAEKIRANSIKAELNTNGVQLLSISLEKSERYKYI